MLIPISFGIGATLTALVGTNIGARQYARARRMAWTGALMAGARGGDDRPRRGDLARPVARPVHPAIPRALASGRHYLSIVGPVYGFFGVAMALYFASQGTGEMYWPVAANLTRITIAAGGSLLALDSFGWGVSGLYACRRRRHRRLLPVLAFSTTRRAWTGKAA